MVAARLVTMIRREVNYTFVGVGTQVLYKQNDPNTIRVNLMYTGPPVLRVTFMYKGSILCTTDPYIYYKGQSYVNYIKLSLI